MTSMLDGMSPEDVRRLLASVHTPSGLTPLDPDAHVFARPENARLFSNVVTINPPAVGAVPEAVPVITVNGRAGIARRWLVQLFAQPIGGAQRGSAADFAMVTWNVGVAVMSTAVDVAAAGSAMFEIAAQQVSLAYAHGNPLVGPITVAAAISPVLAGEGTSPGMFPTRTRTVDMPFPAVPLTVAIPRFACAVCAVYPPFAAATPVPFDMIITDANVGAVIATGRLDTAWTQLPNGSANITLTTNPSGAPARIALIFRLGL